MAAGSGDLRRQKLAKVALAKTNTVSVDVTGIAGDTISKLSNLSQSLGVTYTGNAVENNTTWNNLAAIERHGVTSGMNVSINADPRYFDIASGVYYVNGARIVFPATTVDTVSVNGGEFASVLIDGNGNVSLMVGEFPSMADLNDGKLELTAFSKSDANTIDKIGNSFFTSLDFIKKVYIRHKMFEGTKFDRSAGKISIDGLTVDIEGGYINTPNAETKVITGETNIVGQVMYRVGGVYQIMPEASITLDNTNYDNGDLTTLSNNKYVAHTVSRSSRTDTVYVTIGNTEYSKVEDAIDADYNLGSFEGVSGSEIEPLANVVIEKGATEPIAVIDLRGGVKVTTTSLASVFDSRITDLEARITALENA